jgi:hypothetical protein
LRILRIDRLHTNKKNADVTLRKPSVMRSSNAHILGRIDITPERKLYECASKGHIEMRGNAKHAA